MPTTLAPLHNPNSIIAAIDAPLLSNCGIAAETAYTKAVSKELVIRLALILVGLVAGAAWTIYLTDTPAALAGVMSVLGLIAGVLLVMRWRRGRP